MNNTLTFTEMLMHCNGSPRDWWQQTIQPFVNEVCEASGNFFQAAYNDPLHSMPWVQDTPIENFKQQHRILLGPLESLHPPADTEEEARQALEVSRRAPQDSVSYAAEMNEDTFSMETTFMHDNIQEWQKTLMGVADKANLKLFEFAHDLLLPGAPEDPRGCPGRLAFDGETYYSETRRNLFQDLSVESLGKALGYFQTVAGIQFVDGSFRSGAANQYVHQLHLVTPHSALNSRPEVRQFMEKHGIRHTTYFGKTKGWGLVVDRPVEIGFLGGNSRPQLLLKEVTPAPSFFTFRLIHPYGGVLLNPKLVAGGNV